MIACSEFDRVGHAQWCKDCPNKYFSWFRCVSVAGSHVSDIGLVTERFGHDPFRRGFRPRKNMDVSAKSMDDSAKKDRRFGQKDGRFGQIYIMHLFFQHSIT